MTAAGKPRTLRNGSAGTGKIPVRGSLCTGVGDISSGGLPCGEDGDISPGESLSVGIPLKEDGMSRVTDDRNLTGERIYGEDAYTGRYLAECSGDTGKDVVFGGVSPQGRRLHLCGYVFVCSGEAAVRIRMNGKEEELKPDEDGFFEKILNLEGGPNYIEVQYRNFEGTVELTSVKTVSKKHFPLAVSRG